jgi:hypothetical protein
MHKLIHQIEEKRQAIFVGFFGPIGVSAIFYLYITLEFLEGITVDGVKRSDAEELGEVITVVVWFLAICSIVSPQISPLLPVVINLWIDISCISRALILTLIGRAWFVHPSWKAWVLPA